MQLEAILGALDVLPFEPPADRHYGLLRAALEAVGQPIGSNDMLIAAQALSLGYVLVSDNEREFSRVNGLQLENWLR
jgi:tRNA(fMet)-specific endonuclease VapC